MIGATCLHTSETKRVSALVLTGYTVDSVDCSDYNLLDFRHVTLQDLIVCLSPRSYCCFASCTCIRTTQSGKRK